MAIRFSSGQKASKSPIRAWLCQATPLCAANDNSAVRLDDVTLIGALSHFAQHGLAAAELAGARALMAHKDSDRDACLYWLAVCSELDRCLAAQLRADLGGFAA